MDGGYRARGSSGRSARGRASRRTRIASAASSSGSAGASSATCTASGGPTCRSQADPRHARRDRPRAAASRAAGHGLGVEADPRRGRRPRGDRALPPRLRAGARGGADQSPRSAERRRSRPRSRSRSKVASTSPSRCAAIPTAPLGSITSFRRSNAKRIASTICSSVTVTISSTSRLATSHVSSPGACVCRPSAIVRGTSIVDALARANDCAQSSPACGSTPTTRSARRGPWRSSRSRRSARRRRPGRRACRRGRRPRSARAPPCPGRP